jgi:hypothetical protein
MQAVCLLQAAWSSRLGLAEAMGHGPWASAYVGSSLMFTRTWHLSCNRADRPLCLIRLGDVKKNNLGVSGIFASFTPDPSPAPRLAVLGRCRCRKQMAAGGLAD